MLGTRFKKKKQTAHVRVKRLFSSRNALQCHSSVGHYPKADVAMLWFITLPTLTLPTLTTVIEPVPLCSSTCTVDRLQILNKGTWHQVSQPKDKQTEMTEKLWRRKGFCNAGQALL